MQNLLQCSVTLWTWTITAISQPLKSLVSTALLSPCPATSKHLRIETAGFSPSLVPGTEEADKCFQAEGRGGERTERGDSLPQANLQNKMEDLETQ